MRLAISCLELCHHIFPHPRHGQQGTLSNEQAQNAPAHHTFLKAQLHRFRKYAYKFHSNLFCGGYPAIIKKLSHVPKKAGKGYPLSAGIRHGVIWWEVEHPHHLPVGRGRSARTRGTRPWSSTGNAATAERTGVNYYGIHQEKHPRYRCMPCHRRSLLAAGPAGAGDRRAGFLHPHRDGHRSALVARRGLPSRASALPPRRSSRPPWCCWASD